MTHDNMTHEATEYEDFAIQLGSLQASADQLFLLLFACLIFCKFCNSVYAGRLKIIETSIYSGLCLSSHQPSKCLG